MQERGTRKGKSTGQCHKLGASQAPPNETWRSRARSSSRVCPRLPFKPVGCSVATTTKSFTRYLYHDWRSLGGQSGSQGGESCQTEIVAFMSRSRQSRPPLESRKLSMRFRPTLAQSQGWRPHLLHFLCPFSAPWACPIARAAPEIECM